MALGGYADTAARMVELAQQQDGYLGVESTRDADGFGITVSYWRDEAAIIKWKANAEHLIAQQYGHERWYEHFELRVAKVERAYGKQEKS
jgi:heme-degrading monooxygenase HmoA